MAERQVGTVAGINIYPLKSCPGIPLDEGYCDYQGLFNVDDTVRDRHYAVVAPTGSMLSLRQAPRMCLIKPSIHGNELHVNAPDMPTLVLPLVQQHDKKNKVIDCRVFGCDVQGMDCGDEAADWIGKFLEKEVRLVYSTSETAKRDLIKDAKGHKLGDKLKPDDKMAFQDTLPILMANTASLADIDSKVKKTLGMRNFRPNIVVDTNEAFQEDNWKTVRIGETVFTSIKPCERCKITTIDQDKGVFDPEMQPLKTLRTYRVKPEVSKFVPCFGMLMTITQPGKIKVGDPVHVVC